VIFRNAIGQPKLIKTDSPGRQSAAPSSPPPARSSSQSAESLFGDVLKPFSTASANQRHRGPFFDHLSASTMSSAAPQNCRSDLTWRTAWAY
jgi:hypothetical protein